MLKITISSLLLLITGILFSLNAPLNYAIFKSINQALPWQTMWMTITNSGSVAFTGCLLFIVLRNNLRLLTNALICGALVHYAVKFSKQFFAELRPEHILNYSDLITLGPALKIDNYSMPSGHTATAFIAATFIARVHSLQGWKLWGIFAYATLIGVSRIAVGAHWPCDVFAGASLGIILGAICSQEKLHIQHKTISYITYTLYLLFFILAAQRVSAIDSLSTMISEGIIVGTGAAAVIVWVLVLKRKLTQ